MSIGIAAMLLGVFGVPIALVWAGHRLRRRSRRWRAMFWGALSGYGAAIVLALIASMVPPENWSAQDRLRGLAGFWSLLVLPVLGIIAGVIRAR
jgi:hypothetical protein